MSLRTKRAIYPSDLTDAQWRRVAPLIPAEKGRGRRRSTDLREVVNAINYRMTSGCVWRMLPHDFPPWATIYTYFRDWERVGAWAEIRAALAERSSRLTEMPHVSPEHATCDPFHEQAPPRRSESQEMTLHAEAG